MLTLAAMLALTADPIDSGPKPGNKPGPYSFLVVTGPQRGQPTCYVCDAADKPIAVVFARTLGEPLGRLAGKLDALLGERPESRAWLTLLGRETDDGPKLVEWGRTHAIRSLPLGVFESADGPPAYRLHRDADVTVVLAVKRKVVKIFAFRAGALTDAEGEKILSEFGAILGE